MSEVRFNNAKDNPEDDAPGWMLELPTDSARGQGHDVVKFWDEKEKDVTGTLKIVTSSEVTIKEKKPFEKAKVRAVILQ